MTSPYTDPMGYGSTPPGPAYSASPAPDPNAYPAAGATPPAAYPQQAYPQQAYPTQAYAPSPYLATPYVVPYAVPQQPSNGFGIAGMVCGIVALVFCWVPWFGLLAGIAGAAFGGVGIAHASRTGSSNGPAIAGLICGLLSLVPAILIMVAFARYGVY